MGVLGKYGPATAYAFLDMNRERAEAVQPTIDLRSDVVTPNKQVGSACSFPAYLVTLLVFRCDWCMDRDKPIPLSMGGPCRF
jgi:hypothetical protein